MIKFTSVFKAFPKGGLALKDISFHVAKGEFAFLTGHSGAGKSTVLKLIYADERPTGGEVRVSGFNVAELRQRDIPRLRRRLGIVFQDFRLLEDRTAEENVAFALEVTGARGNTIPARVMRVLTQVGLAAKAQAYPRELSGGEQQRVAIARALVNEPPLLSALSVSTIAFSLFVLGLFGLVAVNLRQALRAVADREEIAAYILPGTPLETVTIAEEDIETFPEVASATYVSEDSALAKA